MYTLQDLPPVAQNKPKDQQEAFVKSFNTALARGLTESEALVSGIGAMKALANRVSTVNKANYSAKQEAKRPAHLPDMSLVKALRHQEAQALLEQEIKKQSTSITVVPNYLGQSLSQGVVRNVIAANFDSQDRFVILFDTGEKLVSKSMAIKEYVEQYVSVSMGSKDIVPGNYVTYTKALSGFSVSVTQAEHGVAVVNPVTVRNASGKEVEVSVEVDTAQTVTITSNISLDGHYAVIS